MPDAKRSLPYFPLIRERLVGPAVPIEHGVHFPEASL
jgi:hypothetical protein